MELKICHLFPDIMSACGDRGNLICMEKRLQWRGIGCTVGERLLGDPVDFSSYDIFFIGGSQNPGWNIIAPVLDSGMSAEIRAAARDGRSFFCVCGGYRLMCRGLRTAEGRQIDLAGAVDAFTDESGERVSGPLVFDSRFGTVAGFENHGGKTVLGSGASPLGRVTCGYGNNGEDGGEGAVCGNVICTYGQGPLLPRNPVLCDAILSGALKRKYGISELSPLCDMSEEAAHFSAPGVAR